MAHDQLGGLEGYAWGLRGGVGSRIWLAAGAESAGTCV